MDINKYKMFKFLGNFNNIKIPFYQRNYDWGENQINKLINDLIKSENKEYFLGSIILKSHSIYDVVVDGQQRISSLILLLKSLLSTNKLLLENKNIIENRLNSFSFKSFSFGNWDTLERIVYDKTIGEDVKNSKYYKNYMFLKSKFKNWDSESINNLFEKIDSIIFAVIHVDEKLDEHILFSQINSTGIKLSSYDLFRNFLFSKLSSSNCNLEDNDINQYVEDLDMLTKNYDSKTCSGILRRFISQKTKNLPNKDDDKTYTSFIEWFNSNDGYNKFSYEVYNDFCKYLIVYNFISDRDKYKNYSFSKSLNFFSDSLFTYLNIIYDVFDNNSYVDLKTREISINDEQEQEISKTLLVLEFYKVKRTFCDFDEKQITRYIPTIPFEIKKISKVNNELSYSEKLYYLLYVKPNRQLLKNDLDLTYRMPTNDEFKSFFCETKIYNKNKKFLKNFFIRLNEVNNKTKIDYDGFSIEHIMPVDTSKWFDSNLLNDDLKVKIEKYRDTIGNLTLTTYNSEYGNSTFDEKKKKMKEKNESFSLNNYLLNIEKWNIEEIIKRANNLFEKSIDLYNLDYIDKKINNLKMDDYVSLLDEISENEKGYFYLDKNKSYFKSIFINEEIIKKCLIEYLINGNSLEKIEKLIFDKSFKGWVAKTIINFINVKVNVGDDKDFILNKINSSSSKINEMLKFIDDNL
ncbi:DUF262 domain-containing protein [Malacoplasma iowae]|uniref:DUF262 domain-containing protein n=1 Tax=Malacoplasma iowae TaxID=2116 RepID=UPI002A18938B|nr:DUF262 domain-containing HNH endonuclease family protein [Malacoplasma iowae]WPL37953.1 DUF262 domain-containing HNH endonuclease family protein [Malacoplasma iowae]